MSPESSALVRSTWSEIAPRTDEVSRDFYARLFELDPEARALFDGTDMDALRAKFMHTIATMVAVLDDPGVLVSESVPLGRRHGGYGVRARDYELAGTALMDALERVLGDRWTRETRDAWRELYALLAGVMMRAGGAQGAGATRG